MSRVSRAIDLVHTRPGSAWSRRATPTVAVGLGLVTLGFGVAMWLASAHGRTINRPVGPNPPEQMANDSYL